MTEGNKHDKIKKLFKENRTLITAEQFIYPNSNTLNTHFYKD
jgi:hypothetical protein